MSAVIVCPDYDFELREALCNNRPAVSSNHYSFSSVRCFSMAHVIERDIAFVALMRARAAV